MTARYVRDVILQMDMFHGIYLTEDQVEKVLNQAPSGLKKDLEEMGGDTSNRGWFLGELAKSLGVTGHWPCGEDTESYTTAYMFAFETAAKAAGIELDEDFVQNHLG